MRGWVANAAVALLGLALGAAALAGDPAEKSAAIDMTFADDEPAPPAPGTTAPAANPFGEPGEAAARKDAVPGYIELSTGVKIPGKIYTTRAKRLKIYNVARELNEYVPVPAIARIDVTVEWERMDKEWRFKEPGNPEKVYTGREYPVRSLAWTLTLRNDHRIAGHILGQPLVVERDGRAVRFILHQRDKGEMGQTLADVKYIRSVVFGPEAYQQAVEEAKAKAAAAAKPSPTNS
jgi:hypothetical protein